MAEQNQTQAPPPPAPPQEEKASTNALVSMIIGIAAFFTSLWPLGIIALIMAVKERRAIREGRSPKAGDTFALIGLILGIIETVGTVIILIGAIVMAILIPIIIGTAGRGY